MALMWESLDLPELYERPVRPPTSLQIVLAWFPRDDENHVRTANCACTWPAFAACPRTRILGCCRSTSSPLPGNEDPHTRCLRRMQHALSRPSAANTQYTCSCSTIEILRGLQRPWKYGHITLPEEEHSPKASKSGVYTPASPTSCFSPCFLCLVFHNKPPLNTTRRALRRRQRVMVHWD